MAFSRSKWVDKVRLSLERALGEYAKQKYADKAGYKYDWSGEINGLLKEPRRLCSSSTPTKGKFDRKKAFEEALVDARDPVQIKDAQNKLLTYDITQLQRHIIQHTPLWDAEELLKEMLDKFPIIIE